MRKITSLSQVLEERAHDAVIDGWNVALTYDLTIGNTPKKQFRAGNKKHPSVQRLTDKAQLALSKTVDWMRQLGITPLIVGTPSLKARHMDRKTVKNARVVTLDKM